MCSGSGDDSGDEGADAETCPSVDEGPHAERSEDDEEEPRDYELRFSR